MARKMDEAAKRRVRAGRMLLSGKGPTEVAKEVGVARQTVHTSRMGSASRLAHTESY